MASKREEMTRNEVKQCSFAPKIQEFALDQPRGERFENLYRLGTKFLQNRKDKSLEEVEMEKNGKDCTYKPKIRK